MEKIKLIKLQIMEKIKLNKLNEKIQVNNYEELRNCIDENQEFLLKKYGDRYPRLFLVGDEASRLNLSDDDVHNISYYYNEQMTNNHYDDNDFSSDAFFAIESYCDSLDYMSKVEYTIQNTDWNDWMDEIGIEEVFYTPVTEIEESELLADDGRLIIKGEIND